MVVAYDDEEAKLVVPLLGRHNAANYAAALAVWLIEGGTLAEVESVNRGIKPVRGRMEQVENPLSFDVVVDYAHTPDGLEKVLACARDLQPKRVIVVFGAGGDRDPDKRAPMGRAADRLADILVLTSDNPRSEDPETIMDMVQRGISREIGDRFMRLADRREAIDTALRNAEPGDLVILAGKGHETYQEINSVFHDFDDFQIAAEILGRLKGRDHV